MNILLVSWAFGLLLSLICAFLCVLLIRERRASKKALDEAWSALSVQTYEAERRHRLTLNISSEVGSILQSRSMLPQILKLLSEFYAPAELRLLVYRGKQTFGLIIPRNDDEEIIKSPILLLECSKTGFLAVDGSVTPLLRLNQRQFPFLYNLPIIHDDHFAGALVLSCPEKLSKSNQRFLNDMLPSLTAAMRNNRLSERFGKAVDFRVRDHLMSSPMQPDGEVLEAGILFVDIVGFTTQAERLSPDSIVKFLNDFFSCCQAIIAENGGIINKFLGDGFMVIFGAPQRDVNYARNLLRTAHRIIASIPELVIMAKGYGLEGLRIALGAEVGAVLAGTVGSDERLEYTLIGDVVNIASRLEGLTRFFNVIFLAGQSLKKAVPDWHYRALGKIRPKGKTQSLDIFEVLGPPGSVDGKILERSTLFENALVKYQKRDFTGALVDWNSLNSGGADAAIDWYRSKAQDYLACGPESDWDGTEVFRSK